MVVNECNTALQIDQENNLSSYVDTSIGCLDFEQAQSYVNTVTVMSKVMTHYIFDPLEFQETNSQDNYFVQRDRTGLFSGMSQSKRSAAIKTSFDTNYQSGVVDSIPILNLFFESEVTYDAMTYDFIANDDGAYWIDSTVAPRSQYGYYTFNLGEGEK